MVKKCTDNGLKFRPHFKTHQSKDIARLFRNEGTRSVTVSSLKMARYFAEDNWDDILIAFPLNVRAADIYNDLITSVENLSTLAVSIETVDVLDYELTGDMGIYIEIDPDYGRSGLRASETDRIQLLIDRIESSNNFHLKGFYCHAGHTYKARSASEIKNIAQKTFSLLVSIKESFPGIPVCYGDTPSCSALESFGPADELSPGNFVFYDWMQREIGSCKTEDIGVFMRCPVIQPYPDKQQVLIHGGAVHFSKESVESSGINHFGCLKSHTGADSELLFLNSISQEHGIVQGSQAFINSLSPGDYIDIYPVHSCLTADLMGQYYTEKGELLDHMNQHLFT